MAVLLFIFLSSSLFISLCKAEQPVSSHLFDLSSETESTSDSNSYSSSNESPQPKPKALIVEKENLLIFAFLGVLSGAMMIVYIVVKTEFHYLPESVAVVIYGIIIGFIMHFINTDIVEHLSTFDPELFFLFLLPSIIFESGFSLQKTPFFKNIGPILLFAVLGTLVSFAFVGLSLYGLGQAGASPAMTLKESMTTGALLSATDTVAVLAIFQALNVDPQLYMVVFGESVLNDAVALILFRAAKDGYSIAYSFGIFFLVSLGSLLLGVGIALILSLIFRVVNVARFPPLETIFMIVFSYMSYVLADALSLSGIVSVFFCGMIFNHYGAYSLSPYTTLTSRQLFRTLAFVCETTVFIYIGISIATTKMVFDWPLIIWTTLLPLIGRALYVFPFSFVLNRFMKNKFSLPIQIAMWFAGLRGAVAFSLALDLGGVHGKQIKTATLIFVHFTLFVMGVGTLPLLKILKIKSSSTDQSLDNISKPREKTEKEIPTTTSRTAKAKTVLSTIDTKYLKPWLRRQKPPLAQEAIDIFERLVSSSNERELNRVRAREGYNNVQYEVPVVSPMQSLKEDRNTAILDNQINSDDQVAFEIDDSEDTTDETSLIQ